MLDYTENRDEALRMLALRPLVLVGFSAFLLSSLLLAEEPKHPRASRVQPGHCLKVAEQLVGHKAVVPGAKIKPPKKLRNVQPIYPTREPSTAGRGAWLGEALIGTDGRIRDVWALREITFEPPWPEFNDAISNAIWEWKYTPTTVDGEPRPVCMTISVTIDWR